jgi:hypothetical protein
MSFSSGRERFTSEFRFQGFWHFSSRFSSKCFSPSTWISATCPSPTNGHDFLLHFGFQEFCLLSFGFLQSAFPRSAWISTACPFRSSGLYLFQNSELQHSRSLLICKFPKCFCYTVSTLPPPIHLALTHGTQSRHIWACHSLFPSNMCHPPYRNTSV